MPPDDARRQDALAWLARAELDLKAARHDSFKALLARHDVAFRKTRNLEELGNQCIPAAENWPPPHRQPPSPQLGNATPAQARRRYNEPWPRCGWKPRSKS
jgi:hypothetical protein